MNKEEKYEFQIEEKVTFEVFRTFFLRMMCRNKITAFLIKLSPYIFITGVFFCLLDMVIFKEESVGVPFLAVVLLMGLFMLFLYYGQPRAVYNANKNEFSLPIKYIYTENGFYVEEESFEKEIFVPYGNLDVVYEFDDAFYFGYMEKTFIVEKKLLSIEQSEFLSNKLKAENPQKHIKLKS